MTRERLQVCADTAMAIKKAVQEGRDWGAYCLAESITELEEVLYLSNQLDAKERNIIKTYREAARRADGIGERT